MANLGFYICLLVAFSNAAILTKRHLHHQESPDALRDHASSDRQKILPTDDPIERNSDENQQIHEGHIKQERDTHNHDSAVKEQYAEKDSYELEEHSHGITRGHDTHGITGAHDKHSQHVRDLDHQEDLAEKEDQETDEDNDEDDFPDNVDLVLTMKRFAHEAVEAISEINLKEIVSEAVNDTALQPIFEHPISKRALELLPLLPAAAIPLIETIIGLFSGLGVATFMDIIPTPKEMIENMLGVNLDVPEGFHEVLPLPKKKDSDDDYHDHYYGGFDSYASHGY
ncbi:uncharacterized protein LOC136034170 [Artemia franciscana]|uniref:Uncharacterized protein n=1 Tax=Artemia franciscana TaxID=6661 RepID=A0AA88L4E9_ARTSF|nr:hypothetical protein QYM36_010746 [Artemia franciscana]